MGSELGGNGAAATEVGSQECKQRGEKRRSKRGFLLITLVLMEDYLSNQDVPAFPVLLHPKVSPFAPETSIPGGGPGENTSFVLIICNQLYAEFLLCWIQRAQSFIMLLLKRRLRTLGLLRGLSCAEQAMTCFSF